jgi:hypothetical protein
VNSDISKIIIGEILQGGKKSYKGGRGFIFRRNTCVPRDLIIEI